jgi:hypothetical protein
MQSNIEQIIPQHLIEVYALFAFAQYGRESSRECVKMYDCVQFVHISDSPHINSCADNMTS